MLAERLTRLCIMEKATTNSPHVSFRVTQLLPKFSKLENLAIESIGRIIYGGDTGWTTDPIELPYLSKLSIRAENTSFFPIIVRSFFSPVLEAVSVDAPLGCSDSAFFHLFDSHTSTLKSLTYHFTYSLSELRVRDSLSEYDASILEDPKDYYGRKCELYGSLWTSASSIESFILCDHTDCSISFLECLIALIFRLDPNGLLNAIEGYRSMPKLLDLTIQIRPITSEWYLQRFATILHNILASRAQFRELALAGLLPHLVSSLDFESLRRRARLRIVFIVEPSDVSEYVKDITDTSSNAHCDSDLLERHECIDYCTSVIREKLQKFVSPSRTPSLRPEQCLDLSFGVLREEGHAYCGEEGLEQPYDTRFLPTRATL
ncbi:uncharacterized protein STEHIDRAFT_164252 [Stereum hirsutum FP-91666 SS1]|uniref:uncharacterized protein n=1 Tax=Stereum hirsutum (strain FP-91666) TaxID=721885 RepID=UPI00044102A5|nr:uncharacterized protein STEHIDRAFT_164252 [Stereum hirsutum FP-91666 SS1]EIM91792.1 hypothetical protein STEHIDRAFT_164252 [Stereum hirsutum FP-91666 SS1]